MQKSVCLVIALVVALSFGLAVPGRAQNPPCDGCFTTPLAASGNGSCVVNMCFTFDPVGPKVTITSFREVLGCDNLKDTSGNPTSAFLEALEKEAIRIAIQRCTGCNPSGKRFFTSVGAKCFRSSTNSTSTWFPCAGTCTTTYEVTCQRDNPYSWIWGAKWGFASSDKCEELDPPCYNKPLCPWP